MRNTAFFRRLTSIILLLAVLLSVFSYPDHSSAEEDRYGRVAYNNVYLRKQPTTGVHQSSWCFLHTGWVVRILRSTYNTFGSWFEVECTIPEDLTRVYTGYILQRYIKEMTASEVKAWLANPVQPGTGLPAADSTPTPVPFVRVTDEPTPVPDPVTAPPAAVTEAPAATVTEVPSAVTQAPSSPVTVDVSFESGDPGFINANLVYFRKRASYSADHWTLLPYGWTLYCIGTVTSENGTWYCVECTLPSDSTTLYTGYVDARYVTLGTAPSGTAPAETNAPTVTPAPSLSPSGATASPRPDASGSQRYVVVPNTFFMESADYTGAAIALLPGNWPVTVLETVESDGKTWYMVSCAIPNDPEGTYYGYIEPSFLSGGSEQETTPSPSPAPTEAATPGPIIVETSTPAPTAPSLEYNAYITAERVFFRMNPSYTAGYYAILPYQWGLCVTGSTTVGNTLWYKVATLLPDNSGKVLKGYVDSAYVTMTGAMFTAAPATFVPASDAPTAAPTAVPTDAPTDAPTAAPTETPAPSATEDPGFSPYALVTLDGTNVRLGDSVKTMTITALPAGQLVTILDTSNGMYLIKTDQVMGYVSADSLMLLTWAEYYEAVQTSTRTPVPTPTAAPTPTPSAADFGTAVPYPPMGWLRISKSLVNLRSTPGGDVLTPENEDRIPLSTCLRYYQQPLYYQNKYWFYVEYNGMFGYVADDCVEFLSEAPEVSPTPYEIYSSDPDILGTVIVTLEEVNFRATPNGKVLDVINIYTRLPYYKEPVTRYGYDWLYVKYKGQFGYIRSDCYDSMIPGLFQPTPTPSYLSMIGYVASRNASLSIYRSPGSGLLTTLSTFSISPYYETVTSNGALWYRIYSFNLQKYGYVSASDVYPVDINGEAAAVVTAAPSDTETGTPAPTATPSPTPRVFNTGYVITDVDAVYIRSEPSTLSKAAGMVSAKGTLLVLTDQAVTSNGVTWYPVSYGSIYGYIHGNYCTLLTDWQIAVYESTGVVPTLSPTGSTQTAAPTPTPAAGVTEAPAVTAAPALPHLIITSDNVNVRFGPSTANRVVEDGLQVNEGDVFAYDFTSPDAFGRNITWYHIQYSSTGWGYVHGGYVRVLTDSEYRAHLASSATPSPSPVPTEIPGVTVPDTYRLLSLNTTGTDVSALQQALVSHGYLAQEEVTGIFADSTQTAVILYQFDHALTATGIVDQETWNSVFGITADSGTSVGTVGANNPGSSVTVTLNPVEISDWYTGDIQEVWAPGVVAIITDVYTGISFQAKRWAGGSHADVEPLTAADTQAMCIIYQVETASQIDTLSQTIESWRRRPLWVTIGDRTFAASMYGIPHNADEGNTISDNNYPGQFCVHFKNSTTHTSSVPDTANRNNDYFGHQDAIQWAYDNSISGTR